MRILIPGLLLLAMTLATGCSTAKNNEGIHDPYEPMNRRVHAFNRGLDANLLRPMTQGMSSDDSKTGPGAGEKTVELVGNFGSNLSLPGKVVNHLLQGRPIPAVKNTFRFLVNSTLGVAGFFDPAGADFALPEQDTDFGETLAVWGVPEGAYLELPLIGPSTERDAAGRVVDLFTNPLNYRLNRDQRLIGFGARVVSKAGERGRFGDSIDSILHESADSYAQTRLIYLQHRRYELGEKGDEIDPYAE